MEFLPRVEFWWRPDCLRRSASPCWYMNWHTRKSTPKRFGKGRPKRVAKRKPKRLLVSLLKRLASMRIRVTAITSSSMREMSKRSLPRLMQFRKRLVRSSSGCIAKRRLRAIQAATSRKPMLRHPKAVLFAKFGGSKPHATGLRILPPPQPTQICFNTFQRPPLSGPTLRITPISCNFLICFSMAIVERLSVFLNRCNALSIRWGRPIFTA